MLAPSTYRAPCIEGIHSVVNRLLVYCTLLLMVAGASNVTGVVDGLRKMREKEGVMIIRIARLLRGP